MIVQKLMKAINDSVCLHQCPSEDDHSATCGFANDFDLPGGSEEEQLTERLQITAAAGYSMEISSDKSKILDNSIWPRPSTIVLWINGKMLE